MVRELVRLFHRWTQKTPKLFNGLLTLPKRRLSRDDTFACMLLFHANIGPKIGRIGAVSNPEVAKHRKLGQKKSRKMLKHVIEIIKKLQGGHFACSFEWPDGCDGFDFSEVSRDETIDEVVTI